MLKKRLKNCNLGTHDRSLLLKNLLRFIIFLYNLVLNAYNVSLLLSKAYYHFKLIFRGVIELYMKIKYNILLNLLAIFYKI